MKIKIKLQQDQLAKKDRDVFSWKRELAEAIKAQNHAIKSRYEAVRAREEAIKVRTEAIEATESALKDFQQLQEYYSELWQRSDIVTKEKNRTIEDVKTTKKRKNNEVLVRISNGEKATKPDEDWIQSHRRKSQGGLARAVLTRAILAEDDKGTD